MCGKKTVPKLQERSNFLSLTEKFQSFTSSQSVSERTIHIYIFFFVAGRTFEKELKFLQQPECDLKAEFLNAKTFFSSYLKLEAS